MQFLNPVYVSRGKLWEDLTRRGLAIIVMH